jgi:hypothetical protein
MEFSTIKSEIKKELIDYYDSITNKLDIRAQQLLTLFEQENDNYDGVKKINQKYNNLLKKIESCLNSNLDEINNYFDSFKREIDNKTIDKNYLKQNVLSSYLIYIEFDILEDKYKNIHELGVVIDCDWILKDNELNYIR